MEASSDAKYFISTHEDSFRVHHLKLFFLWGHGNFGSAGAQNISAQVFMKEKNQAKTNQNKPKTSQNSRGRVKNRVGWNHTRGERRSTNFYTTVSCFFLSFPQFSTILLIRSG